MRNGFAENGFKHVPFPQIDVEEMYGDEDCEIKEFMLGKLQEGLTL